MDVFNAGARLGTSVTDTFAKERKYTLDQTLFQQANELEKIQYNLILRSPEHQNDPKAYRDMTARELDKWHDGAVKAGNNSRYYLDQLDRIKTEGDVSFQKKLFDLQFANERNKVFAAYENTDSILSNLSDPYEAYDKRNAEAEKLFQLGEINDVQLQKEKSKIANEEYRKAITFPSSYTGTIKDWTDQVNKAFNDTDRFGITENREAEKENAIHVGTTQIQNREYKKWYAEQTKFEDLVRRARDGDSQAWQALLSMSGSMEKTRQALVNGKDDGLREEQRSQMVDWWKIPDDLNPKKLSEKSARSGSTTAPREKEAGSTKPPTTITERERNNIIQELLNGLNPQPTGLDSSGNQRSSGITLAQGFREIDRLSEERGLNALEEKRLITKGLLGTMALKLENQFVNDEGAKNLRTVITISDDVAKELKISKEEQLQMETDLAQNAFNIMAEFNAITNPTQAQREALDRRLKQMRRDYEGDILVKNSLLKDLPGTDGTLSISQNMDSGNLTKAGKGYYQLLNNSAAATKSWDGSGSFIPGAIDDTAASYISLAQGLLEKDLGFDKSKIRKENGKEVYATGKDGKEYRIVPTEDGKWRLERQDEEKKTHVYGGRNFTQTSKKWVPIAERGYPGENLRSWFELDNRGRQIRTQNGRRTVLKTYTGPNR
jgi:hypothetical protein